MKKLNILLLFTLGVFATVQSQTKTITVEDIYQGAFHTEGLEELRSLKGGKEYTVLNVNKTSKATQIDKYTYETLEKIETLVSSESLDGVLSFSTYEFSNDESRLLLATDVEPIYRHSRLGIYYVYDISSKSLTKVADKKIQAPNFSPNGKQVAFGLENNLYLFDIESKTTKQLTMDGTKNHIINGITDWVYEEEFAFVRAFEWAIYPDKNHGIYGGNTRIHLYNKMTNFIKTNL